jgi:hypothetical protein
LSSIFDVLIVIARPAAGKSELIQYLRNIDVRTRMKLFHIGSFTEIDDFPMLWTWFEEDGILEDMGKPRLHTTPDGYFKYTYLWDLLIRRINLEYAKHFIGKCGSSESETCIIEFSRGSSHGGFARAFAHLDKEILARTAVLYIQVSYEESFRKNRRRFNPARPHSILEHALPDDKMEALYRESDWEAFARDSKYLHVRGLKIPYVVFENEDDVTTRGGTELGARLENVLGLLWTRYSR